MHMVDVIEAITHQFAQVRVNVGEVRWRSAWQTRSLWGSRGVKAERQFLHPSEQEAPEQIFVKAGSPPAKVQACQPMQLKRSALWDRLYRFHCDSWVLLARISRCRFRRSHCRARCCLSVWRSCPGRRWAL